MNRVLRVGIVGFGAVARLHCEAYRSLGDVEIVGVTDRDSARLDIATAQFGLHAYTSLEAMLASASLDIACVLTPPATHEELVCQCASARIHVLCEKPLALSVAACRRIIAACRERNVLLCYGASYRYLPALIAAREIIQRGDLGGILLLREYAVGGRGLEHRGTLGYGHYPKDGPGGSGMGLCDHGIHMIDTFSWLIGSSAVRASGRGNISGQPQAPEFAHLEYANGAIGQLLYEDGTYSTDLPQDGIFAQASGWSVGGSTTDNRPGSWQAHPGCIHVHGTKGALRIFHYANQLFWRDSMGVRQISIPGEPFPANFAKQLESFAQAIRNGGPSSVPGEAGLEAWQTLQTVYAVNDVLPQQ